MPLDRSTPVSSLQPPASDVDKCGARVRAMFSDIAHRYDFLNHFLSANQDVRWRKRAVRVLGVRRADRVLDLCCGTGDLSFELLRRQPRCQIVAADFALRMLERGARKAQTSNPQFVCADALRLPFGDGYFDGAMCAFGARNFENTESGLCEVWRVLKPNGRLLILEFMRPQSALVQKSFAAFNLVLAPLGKFVSGHPTAYSYLPQSVGGFYNRREFVLLLRRVGFQDVRYFDHGGGIATSFIARKSP
jgi:demethylmenaquinone methyltransferase/2-methoxy-6-polyprenyl-1,4-benzoquinol methylase